MAIRPTKAPLTAAPSGGTPRGNSFISAAASCWWLWALRYLGGIVPTKARPPLDFGSAYHAVLEGQDVEAIRAWAPDYVDAAVALVAQRRREGPPLPSPTAIEETHTIFEGLMTSKPDREELVDGKRVVRDFKTTMRFSKTDEAYWAIEPGIIGEMVAHDTDTALVDVIRKLPGTDSNVRIFTVRLTPQKKAALQGAVVDFWQQVLWRLSRVKKRPTEATIREVFPKQLKSCVGKYGPCDYYERCWGTGLGHLLYETRPRSAWAKEPVKLDSEVYKVDEAKVEAIGKCLESLR